MIGIPEKIGLNDDEKELFKRVQDSYSNKNERFDGKAMSGLFRLLDKRNAIPEIRIEIFERSELAEFGKKSILDNFNSNGRSNEEVIEHPHFYPYLEYFINGPSLPENIIEEFVRMSNQNVFVESPELTDDILKFVRSCIKKYRLEKNKAKSDFFRLAIETRYSINDSKHIREAVTSVKV